jgi:rubrerythrin
MAIVKANYVKRGRGAKSRAKATIRYITHRRDREGNSTTRDLFGWDGLLTKEQTYRMIDGAPRGTIFYRIVVSPAPRNEDTYKDINLTDLTLDTLLALEERLGRHVQFAATVHDNHSPNRHVHTLVLVNRRLTREDFRVIRQAATRSARQARRLRDLVRSRARRRVPALRTKYSQPRRRVRFLRSFSYTCGLCGYHQTVPAPSSAVRCPLCGIRMQRNREFAHTRLLFGRGWGRIRGLSP